MTPEVGLTWTRKVYADVVAHLRSAPERVAFMQAENDERPKIVEALLMQDADVIDNAWCVELADDARCRVLQWASGRDGWLIEAHSHLGSLGDPAAFSSVDLASLAEWVPHVRWRLRWRPYAALVFGPQTFDGLAWRGNKNAMTVRISTSSVAGRVERSTCQTRIVTGNRNE